MILDRWTQHGEPLCAAKKYDQDVCWAQKWGPKQRSAVWFDCERIFVSWLLL